MFQTGLMKQEGCTSQLIHCKCCKEVYKSSQQKMHHCKQAIYLRTANSFFQILKAQGRNGKCKPFWTTINVENGVHRGVGRGVSRKPLEFCPWVQWQVVSKNLSQHLVCSSTRMNKQHTKQSHNLYLNKTLIHPSVSMNPLAVCFKDRYTLIEQSVNFLIEQSGISIERSWNSTCKLLWKLLH